MRQRTSLFAISLGMGLSALACTPPNPSVIRVFDDGDQQGSALAPNAYALYLEGVLAESNAKMQSALSFYEQASALAPEDLELQTRLATVRCALGTYSSFDALVKLDPAYAPALREAALCRAKQPENTGKHAETDAGESAQLLLARAALVDPAGPESQRTGPLAMLRAQTNREAATAAAWITLGDRELALHHATQAANAYASALALSPSQAASVVRHVDPLVADGALRAAEHLAGALVDARNHGTYAPTAGDALTRRLAIDDALRAQDVALVERRAVISRITRSAVASRAWVLGNRSFACSLVAQTAAADPSDADASTMQLLCANRETAEPATVAGRPHSFIAKALLALVLAPQAPDAARMIFGPSTDAASGALSGDPLELALEVQLGLWGIVTNLSLEARIEVAARSGIAPPTAISQSRAHNALASLLRGEHATCTQTDADASAYVCAKLGTSSTMGVGSLSPLALRGRYEGATGADQERARSMYCASSIAPIERALCR